MLTVMSELKSMQPRLNNKSGFTLVELLIVIVVIAILAAVSVVAYNGVNDRALRASSIAGLNVTEKALKGYVSQEGTPLYIPDSILSTYSLSGNQYYLGGNGMKGVCLAGEWPTRQQMADDFGAGTWGYSMALNTGINISEAYSLYCAKHTNQHYTVAMRDTISASSVSSMFAKMPMMRPIRVSALNTDGSQGPVMDVRGVRYAFNGSLTSPVSYLYYAVTGKTCEAGDVSIRWGSTEGIGVGPGGVFPGFTETGGDYTNNNSQYCLRTIR